MTQDRFIKGRESLDKLSADEIDQITDTLLAELEGRDPDQDEWFVYRGAASIVHENVGGEEITPEAAPKTVYRQAAVYECRESERHSEYRYVGVVVTSANDNSFSRAA
jgi:hypothetical protein